MHFLEGYITVIRLPHEMREPVKIFKKYGWKWGGDWHGVKDYQHFSK